MIQVYRITTNSNFNVSDNDNGAPILQCDTIWLVPASAGSIKKFSHVWCWSLASSFAMSFNHNRLLIKMIRLANKLSERFKQPYHRLRHHPHHPHPPNHPCHPLLRCQNSCRHNHCHILRQRRNLIRWLESLHLSVHQMIFPTRNKQLQIYI